MVIIPMQLVALFNSKTTTLSASLQPLRIFEQRHFFGILVYNIIWTVIYLVAKKPFTLLEFELWHLIKFRFFEIKEKMQ